MATVNDIVTSALRQCGIRDTTDTARMAEGLAAFNYLVKSWEEILQHAPIEENFTLTAGTVKYTIGSGGTFDTDRPMRIISAFIRDSDGLDHTLNVSLAKEEYDDIRDKDNSTRPTGLYYAPENPLGIIYFNSAPSTAEAFYLTSNKPFSTYASLDDTILLPIEYEKALIYQLAIDLSPEYNVDVKPTVIGQSNILKEKIAVRNSSKIPSASFDAALLRK